MSDGRTRMFFTSDWHIGHANVIQFDKRPFTDLNHMHRVLVNNYIATVGAWDTCFFLGDMGLTKSEALRDIVSSLHGTKILILGNHDKGATAMRSLGFDLVLDSASISIGGEILTMSHCPLRGVWREDVSAMKGAIAGEHWHGESRHRRFSVENSGQFHLHGHTHKPPEERILGRQFDVGVRANNYRPVSMSTIEGWVNRQKRKSSSGA